MSWRCSLFTPCMLFFSCVRVVLKRKPKLEARGFARRSPNGTSRIVGRHSFSCTRSLATVFSQETDAIDFLLLSSHLAFRFVLFSPRLSSLVG